MRIERGTWLRDRTTLGLGGPAEFSVEVHSREELLAASAHAKAQGMPFTVLGGGSNVVVADEGVPGLVAFVGTRGLAWHDEGHRVRVTAEAGEPWDTFVTACVERGLRGVECLAGIPGLVGATPIQNVGAYGQEVAEAIASVTVLDRTTGEVQELPAKECGFGYRTSRFKGDDRFVVLAVTFLLEAVGTAASDVASAPVARYAELARALSARGLSRPTVGEVRDVVVGLRRGKSMVLDPEDDNRRSVGSFFTNPVVSKEAAARVVELAVAQGLVANAADVPTYPVVDGGVKLAAGWLIERAGIPKGLRHGPVGVSTKHALALVHHGDGTTADLLALARHVRDTVRAAFGVVLVPEPVFLGVSW